MLDNPEAIFSALLAAPDMQHLSHVWVLANTDANRRVMEQYRDDPRVRFVTFGSARYFEALARSQYLVNNSTFPPEFGKREGQTYINTWHGTPVKAMGYDIPGGGPATRNIVRNFVSADYLLSANEFMTQTIYESAYKLRGIYRGRIVQEGSPRVDRQFMTEQQRTALREELVSRGVALDPGQKLVLYAPTWRGDFYSPVNDMVQLLNRVRLLDQQVGSRYRVLLKVHQRVYDFAVAQPQMRELLVPNDIPTNAALGATDVLLTDYSSIFFDFLATGRPVLFYLPDEATYTQVRGLYLAPDQLPGPVSHHIADVARQLMSIGAGGDDDPLLTHGEVYARTREGYASHEDGDATRRVIDVIFRGRTEGYDVRDDFSDGRTSILIYLGGMRTNGITQSGLNLLDNIDHRRFDVSVCYAHSLNEDCRRNEDAINPYVRLFPRVGGINGSKLFWFGRRAMLTTGMDAGPSLQRGAQVRLFHDEWVRCFGDSTFDHIVDFSGYNPFWDYVLLQGEAKTRSVFLHNDVLADSQREIGGRRPHERNLLSVFSTYRKFDNLVSVSPALSEINRAKLAQYADPEKFVTASNTINSERILRMAHGLTGDGPSLFDPKARGHLECPEESAPLAGRSGTLLNLDDLPRAIEALMRRHPLATIIEEVNRKDTILRLVPPAPGVTTFVTAGRLSPEKNHARLIRAFDLVHRDNPNTRLVIMGGGPLRQDLEGLVVDLGLVTSVTLPGRLANPYPVMANSDCFVLSSNYEGQPMVLLEAMVLGLPIVTTDFASVRGTLPSGHGRVVPRTVEGLADGMRAYLAGEVGALPFDYVTYNREAVEQFYRAIGATTAKGVPA
jgi:CDP-glycerol glycerophosphotransferase (TagB/SpsB family)/glycosyltransferase involved in cell wall biosynthesis